MSSQLSKRPVPLLGIKEISRILPHRYPFLLVDKVLELDPENSRITAIKCLTINEAFFQGHFPEAPIMPGVLILEALAQAGGILIREKGYKEQTAVLLSINNAKFRRPVSPGDTLYLKVQGLHFGSKGGKVEAKAFIDNELLAAEAEIGFALRGPGQI